MGVVVGIGLTVVDAHRGVVARRVVVAARRVVVAARRVVVAARRVVSMVLPASVKPAGSGEAVCRVSESAQQRTPCFSLSSLPVLPGPCVLPTPRNPSSF